MDLGLLIIGCLAILEGFRIKKKGQLKTPSYIKWWILIPRHKKKDKVLKGKDAERFANYNILAGAALILFALFIYFS